MQPEASKRTEVAKVLASPLFSNSPRMTRFLRFISEETLAGRQDRIKESIIGVGVFDKDPAYDPRADPTVRTEASKLRAKLQAYYEKDGSQDPLIISIPKGGYIPVFTARPAHHTPAARLRAHHAVVGAVILALAGFVVSYPWLHGHTGQPTRPGGRIPRNQDAYRFYLKGESYASQGTLPELRYAIQYLNLAITADPDYALAHASLAMVYVMLANSETTPTGELLPQITARAKDAMRLEASLPESHDAMAQAILTSEYDWEAAAEEFQRAISLDPAYSVARVHYARMCLGPRGLYDEAAWQLEAGLDRDPLAYALITEFAVTDVRRGRIAQGIDRLRQNLARYPDATDTLTQLAIALAAKSEFEEAGSLMTRARKLSPSSPWIASHFAISQLRLGRKEAALNVLKELTTGTGFIPYYSVAAIYAALGDVDSAFEHLERAWSQRAMQFLWLTGDPRFAPLRSDPRHGRFLVRVRLK